MYKISGSFGYSCGYRLLRVILALGGLKFYYIITEINCEMRLMQHIIKCIALDLFSVLHLIYAYLYIFLKMYVKFYE